MRYRARSETGDYTFGRGSANFLVNSPACVGQLVEARLELWQGNWFLDTSDGMPWATEVLGTNTKPLYDLAIQQRILETPGVVSIVSYQSTPVVVGAAAAGARGLQVSATIETQFSDGETSTTNIQVTI